MILIILLTWLVYLFVQGMVINGIFLSAQGTSETLPDGKLKHSEMILYPLYRYLTQHNITNVYYRGSEFAKLVARLPDWFPKAKEVGKSRMLYDPEDMVLVREATGKLEKSFIGVRVDMFDTTICFYREYKTYRFSKWVRKPLIECVKCMASFWGTLLFWPAALVAVGFEWWLFPLWVINCFSLVFVNAYLYKKVS